MNTCRVAQPADHNPTENHPHPRLQVEPGQPQPEMAPLPPLNLWRHALYEIANDRFSIWVIGFACGLIVSVLALEASLGLTYGLFLYR